MKKVFVLIAAAIVCMSASAQFQIGGKVGFDMTNFWGQDVDHGMKPGYQFGLMMEYKFNPHFAIAPEVVFASQGGKSKALAFKVDDDFDFDGVTIADVKYTANYINVPLMLKFYATPEFSIDFGPQVGFNVFNKAKVKGAKKSVDAFVQARYTLGLTKVFKDEEVLGENKAKNGNIQVAFGMKF